MKRIFIAADISEEARQKASAYIDELRRSFPQLRVGWERPEKLHLTLKFLGDLNDVDVEEVRRAVENVATASGPILMTLRGTGTFPPKGDPRILWLGIAGDGELALLAASIERELAKLGFEKEKRTFSPHLTIARLREPRASIKLAHHHAGSEFGPVVFEVGEVVIYESKLFPTGSVYDPVAKLPLKGG